MFLKQAVCISTAAGGGMKSANKDMADSLSFWGIPRIYRYGVAVRAIAYHEVSDSIRKKIDRKTTALAKRIMGNQGKVRPKIRTRALFLAMHFLQRNGFNEADRTYWTEKGWTGRVRPWK